MARNRAGVERIRGGVDQLVSRAVDATVYLPLGIYDRTRDRLSDVDAKRLRKTFGDLLDDFIDRGQERVQPLERRLRREGRKVDAEVSDALRAANQKAKKTTRTAKKTTRTAKKTTARAKRTTKRTTRKTAGARPDRRTTAAASNAQPKLPRATAPRSASELPIAGYASLTVEEITARLSGLTQTDLAKVYKYEKAHDKRATILQAVEGKLVDLPIPTYDALSAEEITGRLGRLDRSELETIKSYESATKVRSTIIEKVDELLSK
ncbi:MAG: hypothetical protein ACRDK3_08265 [Actinomycetota bacterium]